MSENERELWSKLASEAARDPSRASQLAGVLLDRIDTEGRTGDVAPEGYLYAGAHTFIARVRDLEVEPLPTLQNPKAVPIWDTSSNPQIIKIPFDSWIYAVGGWARAQVPVVDGEPKFLGALASGAWGNRDLFSLEWGLDGQVWFMTDGRGRKMVPASVAVGTRDRPRRMSWTVRRNQVIQVRFRNLFNAIAPSLPADEMPKLAEAAIAFYAVNLEAP